MHCDTISRLYYNNEENLRKNDFDIDLDKMIKGYYLLQNFAIFILLIDNPNPKKDCIALIDKYYAGLENDSDIIKTYLSLQKYY